MDFSTVEMALESLRMGKPIIVVDDEDRENEGDLVALAERATPELVNYFLTHARGLLCVPMTAECAARLGLAQMAAHNTDRRGTAFTVSVDIATASTGISAAERAATVAALAMPQCTADDFRQPGHVFPIVAREGGVLRRAGHTEAAVDLARLCGAQPVAMICEILREDGEMARLPDLQLVAAQTDTPLLMIQDLIAYRRRKEVLVQREVQVDLPTSFGSFRAVGYTNVVDSKEHVALVRGDWHPHQPVLVRVHSECLTGDVFRSQRCDCGLQLEAALHQITQEGSGVLLYMRQEGRGIGLLNKLRAYKLQEDGLDTVEANHRLGFGDDLREYGIGAQILRDLKVCKMRLLTNNPRKITGLRGYGLEVTEVVPLECPTSGSNRGYMEAKKEKLGHRLRLSHPKPGGIG
ncbi:bifunctional 3,4-dihydroxy-2-butanone-4-phosphate synthase/GTP cyclohydrolase II [Pasteuria penetrans]|uniref:bifunctional 3,4-dihydroxy-2-butanone-4-phosphate synthase/GTP cyclohydrolase II n=1 Tax=Pasteuria penetrans TaxID=86005 RepID=UPI0011EBC2A9|nr:bifunctional 3,4-dihydroxy-2-butanone-4-phosphate synthase/GTP cyclohydrolase II [Pasteuria penetrans]